MGDEDVACDRVISHLRKGRNPDVAIIRDSQGQVDVIACCIDAQSTGQLHQFVQVAAPLDPVYPWFKDRSDEIDRNQVWFSCQIICQIPWLGVRSERSGLDCTCFPGKDLNSIGL